MNMHFSNQIRSWYKLNFRDLPWRETKDAYLIWVSEIILQQTRVDQGLPYFKRFITRFPNIESLATADEHDVLKIWQGLGYYSRARNMHSAAKVIRDNFNSQFPANYEDIISLKGIGEYTAAAIASFAFDLPYPVLDGNVFRVLARYTGNKSPINVASSKKVFLKTATKLLDPKHAAAHNQAIMEIGALICTPSKPKCTDCPIQSGCFAFANKSWNDLPAKISSKPIKTRHLNYLVITNKKSVLLQKRTTNDIWNGLHEFLVIETDQAIPDLSIFTNTEAFFELTKAFSERMTFKEKCLIRHKLTHRILEICFWLFEIEILPKNLNSVFAVEIDKINHTFALPKPIEQYLSKHNFQHDVNK